MSDALNELKKATMASYLAKAGRRVRTSAKLATDFEHDGYKDMAVANKHHPNMVTPGFEKDPEKLAAAEKSMKGNFDLRDTFKRQSDNRIKGIARAGRLLAKEESVTEGKNPYGPGYKLVDKEGNELKVGHKFLHTSHHEGSKPEHHEITGWQSGEQRGNSSSSGRVAVRVGKGKKSYETEYFPHVFGMKVVKEDAEPVNELSRSTLASVATKRYQQAQAALKDKDFGGYVKGMKKAIKAADATTPNVGWSPEDDKKNEEFELSEGQILFPKRGPIHKMVVDALKDKGVPHTNELRDDGSASVKWKSEHQRKAKSALKFWYDSRNEEVVPEISAQEKYRQIREAKIRARKGK